MELAAYLAGLFFTLFLCAIWKFRSSVKQFISRVTADIEQPVTVVAAANDNLIVRRTRELLSERSIWDKNYQGHCVLGEKLTLYCALALSAKELTGNYDLLAAYRQTLLQAISKKYPERYHYNPNPLSFGQDPLLNFNNHPSTSYDDLISLLDGVVIQNKTT